MSIAMLFPGQGAQYVGMGKALYEASPAARRIYDLADTVVGYKLSELCFNGPPEELTRTRHTQPAVVTTSLACFFTLADRGVQPDVCAGHSVGEYAALVAAGVLEPEPAIHLAFKRGQLMEDANARAGSMAALLAIPLHTLEEVCKEVSAGDKGVVVVANVNSPDQLVISGDVAAVDAAAALALHRGARRSIKLNVSGAFHSPLMEPAAKLLGRELETVHFRNPSRTFVSSMSAQVESRGAHIKELLKDQITSRVRWEETMQVVFKQNPDYLMEVGPGTALSGMLRKASKQVRPLNVADPDSLERAVKQVLENVSPA